MLKVAVKEETWRLKMQSKVDGAYVGLGVFFSSLRMNLKGRILENYVSGGRLRRNWKPLEWKPGHLLQPSFLQN